MSDYNVEVIQSTDIEAVKIATSKCYNRTIGDKALLYIIEAGHLSVMEHSIATLDLTCSQKVLAQITRHRHFSFTVQSSRGMDMGSNGYINKEANPFFKEFINNSIETSIANYNEAIKMGIPYEQAAYMLPLGSKVRLTISGNLRTWMEYLKKRVCKRASLEHRELAIEIYDVLHELYPNYINLDNLGICKNCKEASCDFTTHSRTQKEPIIIDLKHKE